MHLKVLLALCALVVASLMAASGAVAATTCTFATSGSTTTLEGDCVTDETIGVPDGVTLDGNSHTIVAQDPPGDHFRGAVVASEGDWAHVTGLTVTANELVNTCDGGPDRLRGIIFDGAGGAITRSTVIGINQGPSGCQEGNAIEVRNAPFDATGENPAEVTIAHNVIDDYQKTGIIANGTVDAKIVHNSIGDSATQENLAANSVQLGFGALGSVEHNQIEGNQWLGASNWGATAVLLYLAADGATVSKNNIGGNSDLGIYAKGSGSTIDNNRVFDKGPDGLQGDFGIASAGENEVTNNKVRGFDTPYWGVSGGKNKSIPGPQSGPAF